MNEVAIGTMIRKEREAQGLTQQMLCEGICDITTLSRLETGQTVPAMHRLRALLQRLGLPEERVYALVGERELKLSELERELVSLHVRFFSATEEEKPCIRVEVHAKQESLLSLAGENDRLVQQTILRSKFLIGTKDGPYGVEDGLTLLLDAIRLTSPKFDLQNIACGLYSETEIKLINNIAVLYLQNGMHLDSVHVLRQLLAYLDGHTKKLSPVRVHLPMVLFNYARELCELGYYDESIDAAERGRKICISYGHYQHLPDLLAILAEAYCHKGDMERGIRLYTRAYGLYDVLEDEHNKRLIWNEAKELAGIELE